MAIVNREFQDREHLVVELAGRIAALLAAGIKNYGNADSFCTDAAVSPAQHLLGTLRKGKK